MIAYPIRQGPRFAMPLLPILFAYLIDAVARIRLDRRRSGRLVLATLPAASLLLHGRGLVRTDVPDTYGTDEARRFLEFVRTGTPDDAVIAFAKPRALYLMTGRRGFCPHEMADEPLWQELETHGATHVVLGGPRPAFLQGFAARFPDRLTPVYASVEFTVLRVRAPASAPPSTGRLPTRPRSRSSPWAR